MTPQQPYQLPIRDTMWVNQGTGGGQINLGQMTRSWIGALQQIGNLAQQAVNAALNYQPIPTSYRFVAQTGTLSAQNLRIGSVPLAAGTYRISWDISVNPAGAAIVNSTLSWTNDQGNALSQGLNFSGSGALNVNSVQTIETNGSVDVTIAVGTVTGTVTYNLTVVIEKLR